MKKKPQNQHSILNFVYITQGYYTQYLTLELRGLIWFFHYTFSHKVISAIDNSNNFQCLNTAKSFLNWSTQMPFTQRHYPSANIDKFISQSLDSIQATRCKVINKHPIVSNVVSLYWVFLTYVNDNLICIKSLKP